MKNRVKPVDDAPEHPLDLALQYSLCREGVFQHAAAFQREETASIADQRTEPKEVIRMKHRMIRNLVVLAVMLLVGATTWRLHIPREAEAQQGLSLARTQWEYLIVELRDIEWQTEMNKHGGEGWELVFVRRTLETYGIRLKTYLERGLQPDIKYQCIFKRSRTP